MKLRFIDPLAAAAVVGTLALPAHGSSSASATLGPLTIELVDLAPADGIAPWVDFTANASRAIAEVSQPGLFDGEVDFGSALWDEVAAHGMLSLGNAHAELAGAASGGAGALLRAAGGVAAPFGYPPGSEASFYARVWPTYSFLGDAVLAISPYTEVTISGDVAISLETSSSSWGRDQAWAQVSLLLSGDREIVTVGCDSQRGQQCSNGGGWTFSVSFSNATAEAAVNSFHAYATVSGHSQAVAVPEPATATLWLAGGACSACWHGGAPDGEASRRPAAAQRAEGGDPVLNQRQLTLRALLSHRVKRALRAHQLGALGTRLRTGAARAGVPLPPLPGRRGRCVDRRRRVGWPAPKRRSRRVQSLTGPETGGASSFQPVRSDGVRSSLPPWSSPWTSSRGFSADAVVGRSPRCFLRAG